jgi:hypothetical protein
VSFLARRKENFCRKRGTPAVNNCLATEPGFIGSCVHADHYKKGRKFCFWRIEGENSTLCLSPDAEKAAALA